MKRERKRPLAPATILRRGHLTEEDIRKHLSLCPPACDCACKYCQADPGLAQPSHPEED